ncbi:MAG: ATP-binding protein [Eubacteriales bacterium]|nr:ATP-binding protein [Eubacteriales bacterium]
MAAFIERMTSLLPKAVEIVKHYEKKAVFPNSGELSETEKNFPPNQKAFFKIGMETYCALEKSIPKESELIHGALYFYLSYENPPPKVRMAIINLLRLGGDYKSACLYAFESLELPDIESLLFEHMPLIDREKKINVQHLALPGWNSELILAALTCQFRTFYRSREQRSRILLAIIYGIQEPEQLPPFLLRAVCAFLYVNVCRSGTEEQQQLAEELDRISSYPAVVEKLLERYGKAALSLENDISRRSDAPEWCGRKEKFEQVYAGCVRIGYFVYRPDRVQSVLLDTGAMIHYDLAEADTRRIVTVLQGNHQRHLLRKVEYTHSAEQMIEIKKSKKPDRTEIRWLVGRMKELRKIQNDPGLAGACLSLYEYDQIDSSFEAAEHYEEFSGTFEERCKIFQKYITYNWHDQTIGMKIMQSLLKSEEKKHPANRLMTFFNYYLHVNDYESAKKFAQKYKNRLGDFYFPQTQKQLIEYLERFRNGTVTEKKLPNIQWSPIPVCGGYGNFAAHFLKLGSGMIQSDGNNLDEMSSADLQNMATQMMQENAYSVNQKKQQTENYLKAAAILNRRRISFDSLDMDETMIECLIYAFCNLSYQEVGSLHCDYDVQRSYLEQALRLSGQLNPNYPDDSLSNALEDAVKRYFKSRSGHDDDSLAEAVKYMAKTSTVSKEEFGSRLIRLAVYYPDILNMPNILNLWQSDAEVQHMLITYVKMIEPSDMQSDITAALRKYRDNITMEFNTCGFAICGDSGNLKAMQGELRKVAKWVRKIKEKNLYCILAELDRGYIDCFGSLLDKVLENTEIQDFLLLCRYREECASLLEKLDKKPCSFGLEYVYECADLLREYLNGIYRKLYTALEPELNAEALFAECVYEDADAVNVYVRLSSSGGKAAIRNLTACVPESEYISEGKCQKLCLWVEQGAPEYAFICVHLTEAVIAGEYLQFETEFNYTVDLTGEKRTVIRSLSVMLKDLRLCENYEQMYNTNSALDVGHAMSKYTFYGRDMLVDKICRNFYDFPASIVILYGQRRVGKTSVSNYVTARIKNSDEKFLVVKCGNSNLQVLQDGKEDLTDAIVGTFYGTVLQKLANAIEKEGGRASFLQNEIQKMKRAVCGTSELSVSSVNSLLFQEIILDLQLAFEREDCWRGTRILLWFDEFQQYYLNILRGVLRSEFVGFIKAFTEEYGFSLLLVGCEPMIPFIHDIRFGNTFSAAAQMRVEYLSEEYAENLICEPIQKKSGRNNPFIYVKDEIYKLSAGSPFFIQLICKNLIDDLNDQKRVYANKQMIIDSLYKKGYVKHDKFNCLYDSLDSREEAASPEDNDRVLIQIALRKGSRRKSTRDDIIRDLEEKTQKPVAAIIAELISRKIVEEVHGELRIVVRLYEAWIWENRFELGYHDIRTDI